MDRLHPFAIDVPQARLDAIHMGVKGFDWSSASDETPLTQGWLSDPEKHDQLFPTIPRQRDEQPEETARLTMHWGVA
ncbi:hypothetical protein [Teichococcus vastitatis]|uniref:Uncharacterized protein n=1 Tax=Teichococcus vastitatis TaxID=2307076 RepID=A0ABS9WB79_9PROT|nr:hypothetical protein [Pseudoroseomonas vastitatis]MCI0756145.1 hypothetical protein [Pseudoroseomonas vastitatis]